MPLLIITLLIGVAAAVAQVFGMRRAPAANTGQSSGEVVLAPMQAAFMPLLIAAAVGFGLFIWTKRDITLHSYGFFLIVGYFFGTWNACAEAKRRGYDPNIILDLALPMLIVTVIMCRVLYVVLDLGQFHSLGEMVRIWDGGLSFHGILPGSLMVLAYYSYTRKIGFGTLGDLLAPSVFLGYFWGRIGCLFNGCCYGGVCELPWAMRFIDERYPHQHILTPPSHPTQIYSALLALLLFGFMQKAKKMPRFTPFPGSLILLFWALYAVERAFVEIFRNGTTASTVLGTTWLTQAQFASFVGLVIIAVLWVVLLKRAQQKTAIENSIVAAS